MKKRYWQYRVTGHWPFPTDMLRRDRAKGANADAKSLIELFSRDINPQRGQVAILILGEEKPTIARWKSFGWNVDGTISSIEVDEPLSDADKLDLLAKLRGVRSELGMKRKAAEDAQAAADLKNTEVRRLRSALADAESKLADAESDARYAREEVKEQETLVESILQTLVEEE